MSSARRKFDSMLENLDQSLIEMGRLVEQAIAKATQSFVNKDAAAAKEVIEMEYDINQMERDIEGQCFTIMLQQQPVARDLRMIKAAMKMITDMERMGDQSSDIAEICLLINNDEYIKNTEQFAQMGQATMGMIRDVIKAFVEKDRELALSVIGRDDVVDDLFVAIKDDLYRLMLADVNNGRQALDLLMIAKYYERLGDHAENIAESVIYSITGETKKTIHDS